MATKKHTPPADGQDAYQVLSNLEHDGKRYAPGQLVNLDPDQAEPLLAAGVVQPPAPAAK